MSFRLNWNQLLSDQRHTPAHWAGQSAAAAAVAGPEQEIRTAFERDYDRLIFSAPFRRLARKTQVHPFAEVDHIHNRLTHTLEVASVGRSLAYAVGRLLLKRQEMPKGRSPEDLNCIVQAACLAHDIGNPPFGHAGEYAIREWTRVHANELFGEEMAGSLRGVARDWLAFEGNAQSFRMVARADNREQIYFRLTYASLGALVKYPWDSCDARVDQVQKFNVFSSEKEIFEAVVQATGLRRPDGEVVRHPLSFLAEAADDICYRVADFEDAVQMRILQETEVREIFCKIIGQDNGRPLSALRARAIGCLTDAAIATFQADYDQIMAGERSWERDLKSDFPPRIKEALQHIKDRYGYIFRHRRKVAVELGAYSALGRILETYARAVRQLSRHKDYGQLSFVQQRCLELAWGEKYARDNQERAYAWWLGRVMDFVAGMTDNYALQVANEIGGSSNKILE